MKAIYVHIPRTGGTFLRQYFKTHCDEDIVQIGHSTLSELRQVDIDLNDFYRFAVIRNPFDWYVSRYFYFKRIPAVEGGVSKGCDAGLKNDHFTNKFPTFKHHIMYGFEFDEIGFWLSDRYKYMCRVNGKDKLTHICYFENLAESIIQLLKEYDITPSKTCSEFQGEVGKLNNTKHKHYSKYYTDDLIELVREKDKFIIDKFGYEFERESK